MELGVLIIVRFKFNYPFKEFVKWPIKSLMSPIEITVSIRWLQLSGFFEAMQEKVCTHPIVDHQWIKYLPTIGI